MTLVNVLMALKNHIGKCNYIYRWGLMLFKLHPFKACSVLYQSSLKRNYKYIDMITYTEDCLVAVWVAACLRSMLSLLFLSPYLDTNLYLSISLNALHAFQCGEVEIFNSFIIHFLFKFISFNCFHPIQSFYKCSSLVLFPGHTLSIPLTFNLHISPSINCYKSHSSSRITSYRTPSVKKTNKPTSISKK